MCPQQVHTETVDAKKVPVTISIAANVMDTVDAGNMDADSGESEIVVESEVVVEAEACAAGTIVNIETDCI